MDKLNEEHKRMTQRINKYVKDRRESCFPNRKPTPANHRRTEEISNKDPSPGDN